MNKNKKIKETIQKLKQKISYYNKQYYMYNNSDIEDFEYDEMVKQLKYIEDRYPSLKLNNTVGFMPSNHFNQIQHKYPMLSLDKIYTKKDVIDFIKKLKKITKENKIEFLCEPKIDGISFSALFSQGKLQYAVTRGDGQTGEEITKNISVIRSFPSIVKTLEDFEVRGEAYINKKNFIKTNKEQKKFNKKVFSNARNAASGSLRQTNHKITEKRDLDYIIWDGKISNPTSQKEKMVYISKLGFKTNQITKITCNEKEILQFFQDMCLARHSLDYHIDGLVYKVNDLNLQNKLGNTNTYPKWAIAHKFTANIVQTKIQDINLAVSRTGVITPIAKLTPVNIEGVIIKKVLVHNKNIIKKLDLRVGDIVNIKRSGDVIPQIVSIEHKERKNNNRFKWPNYCPSCGSNIIHEKTIVRCSKKGDCKMQTIKKILHFTSKKGFNVYGLSEKIITKLYNANIVKQCIDIFSIKNINIQHIKGIGKQLLKKLLFSIEKSKQISMESFIYSLGIQNVGYLTAKNISKHFTCINDILNKQKVEMIDTIHNIGPITKNNIYEYLNNINNVTYIQTLQDVITITKPITKVNTFFLNKKIAITGTLKEFTRYNIIYILEKLGGNITNNITKTTDMLIVGKKPGSKLNQAKNIKIKILYERELISLINWKKNTI